MTNDAFIDILFLIVASMAVLTLSSLLREAIRSILKWGNWRQG